MKLLPNSDYQFLIVGAESIKRAFHVSPSGLDYLAALPVVDTTGKDVSPSGLKTKIALRL